MGPPDRICWRGQDLLVVALTALGHAFASLTSLSSSSTLQFSCSTTIFDETGGCRLQTLGAKSGIVAATCGACALQLSASADVWVCAEQGTAHLIHVLAGVHRQHRGGFRSCCCPGYREVCCAHTAAAGGWLPPHAACEGQVPAVYWGACTCCCKWMSTLLLSAHKDGHTPYS